VELDAEVLLRLSLALLASGLLAWIALRLVRPARRRACPKCGKLVLDAAETRGLDHCPQCQSTESPSADGSAEREFDARLFVCRACGQALTDSVTVPLWDGKNYCEICVAEQDATLPDYARRHDVLTAVTPFSFWRAALGGVSTAAILTVGVLCICALFIGVAWWEGQLPPLRRPPRYLALVAAKWVGVGWCLLTVLCCVSSLFAAWLAFPRTVAVQAGRVLISPPGNRLSQLTDLLWADANSKYDKVDNACWPRRKGVVFFTKRTRRRSTGFLVGKTEEDRQRWAAFLKLAGVRRQPVNPWRLAEPKRPAEKPKCEEAVAAAPVV